MQNIFYNYQKKSSFIIGDLIILKSKYNVLEFEFNPKSKSLTPFYFIYQLYILLINFHKYQLIVSQIGAYHTFLPSFFAKLKLKKHIIILHGTECNVVPSLGYGNLTKPILGIFTKFSITNATLLLPVSHALIFNERKYEAGLESKLGLIANIPNFSTPYKTIANGLDDRLFNITNFKRNPKSLLTIALNLEKEGTALLKGVDLILKFAERNKDYKITILGSKNIYNYSNNLPNVKLVGPVDHDKLYEYFNQHKFYLQLSLSESFGLSLCESILCGCFPIVSNTGIMPDIIQNHGFILLSKNHEELASILNVAIEKYSGESQNSMELRANIVKQNYSFAKRETALLETIATLLE